jgi:hypothetical protein
VALDSDLVPEVGPEAQVRRPSVRAVAGVAALTALEAYGKRAKPRGAVVAVEALGLAAESGVVDRAAGAELVVALEEDPGQVSARAAVWELVVEVQAGAAVVPEEAAVSAVVEPSPGNG